MSLFNKIKRKINNIDIIRLIDLIIENNNNWILYNGNLTVTKNFLQNVKVLADFLEYYNFNGTVSYNDIRNFILFMIPHYEELNEWFKNENDKIESSNTDFQNLSFSKMEQLPTQPNIIRTNHLVDKNSINGLRNNLLQTQNLGKRNLNETLASIDFYQQHPIPRPKKPKKEPYGEGMDVIGEQVLSGKRDIRRINDAQSLQGAQRWVRKHGFDEMYDVTNEDVDQDGIPDIIVKRRIDNKPIIVNGYTTVDSTYPYRYRYYTQFPTEEERTQYGKGFKGYIQDIWGPQYDENGLKVTSYSNNDAEEEFARKIKDAGYVRILKPNDKNVYQVFVSKVIKPIYNLLKKGTENGKYPNDKKLAKVASNVWDKVFTTAAMVYVYGDEVLNVDESKWKKLKSRKEIKDAVDKFALPYIINGVDKIVEFFPIFCDAEDITFESTERMQAWAKSLRESLA